VTDRMPHRLTGAQARQHALGEPVTIGKHSVEAYVSAVISLWNQQRSLGVPGVCQENPRGERVKQLCRAHDVRVADRQREFYYDRGARKLDDGYDQDEYLKIIQLA
jgi:hypothetical protein